MLLQAVGSNIRVENVKTIKPTRLFLGYFITNTSDLLKVKTSCYFETFKRKEWAGIFVIHLNNQKNKNKVNIISIAQTWHGCVIHRDICRYILVPFVDPLSATVGLKEALI